MNLAVKRKRIFYRNRSIAFSLIEILIVAAITGTLVVMILSFTLNVLNVWNKTSELMRSDSQVQWVLNLLTRDLESALIRSDGKEWIRTVKERIAVSEYWDSDTDWLMFFSQATDGNPVNGNIRAVSYRIINQNPLNTSDDQETILGLYRTVIDAETTFNHALGLDSGHENIYQNFWIARTLITAEPENFLISGIVDFNITFAYRDISGKIQKTEADKSFIFGGPESSVDEDIVFVDITLTVLKRTGAETLKAVNRNISTKDKEQMRLKHARTYHRRVLIPSYPL